LKQPSPTAWTRLTSLPDFAVLTEAETAELSSLSADNLRRLAKKKLGPPRVRLSDRRYGYPVGKFRAWLDQRTDETAA
jgi:hypothetical protein